MAEGTMISEDKVQQELRTWRKAMVADYEASWQRTLHEWNVLTDKNAVWLTSAANYLLNTRGLKWAVDPMRLKNRLPEAPAVSVGHALRELSFVLLTHSHADHVDTELWSQLADVDCHWIVPEHMIDLFLGVPGMKRCRYTLAVAEKEVVVPGARILPFASLHGADVPGSGFVNVPEMAYSVQTDGGDFLFPGDIRTYEPTFLSRFAGVSTVFAHVFLGRAAARMSLPPLLEAFVTFYRACQPQKVVLTHLYDVVRGSADCWRIEHARMIEAAFTVVARQIDVVSPPWYERVLL